MLNTLKQSGINILRGKKDATTFSRQACFVNRFTSQGFKPLKSEAIHEGKEMPRNIAILDTFIKLQQYGRGGLEVIYKNTVSFLRGPKIALMPKGACPF